MKKILFACDLDNTLLHSHRKKCEGDICAEMLDDREQSFITPLVSRLLEKISQNDSVLLLPVTTRSIAQYKRIQWPEDCVPEFALVCNGAVLLRNGVPDAAWQLQSERMIAPYRAEMERLCRKYSAYDVFKTVRIVDDMFLFTYCYEREAVPQIAAACANDTELAAEYSGSKLYFFPPAANKGESVNRFAAYYGADRIIAAGDSMIDFSMLRIADTALVPDTDMAQRLQHENCVVCDADAKFSEFILNHVVEQHTENEEESGTKKV